MLAIHPIHRRMAELDIVSRKRPLNSNEYNELMQCVRANAQLILRLDGYKQLAFIAHQANDPEWEQAICEKIDELEIKMI